MNQSLEGAWYYTREGVPVGPVAFADLKVKVGEAALDPQRDMVWTEGMADWKPSGEIEGLFEKTDEVVPEPPAPEEAPIEPTPVPIEPSPVASLAPEHSWFYTREGERHGPVAFADLREKAGAAALDPRLDMVWKQGMAEWKPAGEIDGLFEKRAAAEPEPLAPPAGHYTPPKQGTAAEVMGKEGNWPGARRRSFLFMTIIFPFLWGILFGVIGQFLGPQLGPEIMKYIGLAAGILPLIAGIYFSLMRLVNLGMSRWWFLGYFIPFLNFWVGYRCFACPSGYAYHKKLDGVGIALAIFYWLSAVIVILVTAAVVALMFGAVTSPEIQEQLREPLRILQEQLKKA